MSSSCATIYLVDDDASVLRALGRALEAEHFTVRTWTSALAFLEEYDPKEPGCLIADVAMPGFNGLQLQDRLRSAGSTCPIIFISGRGSIAMSVRAMKGGAVTFLTKPVRFERVLAEVREALRTDAVQRAEQDQRVEIEARLRSLTPRELEVLKLIVAGRMSKEIAGELGTAETTVKVHRARVMQKMEARTVADLVALAAQAGVKQHI